MKKVFMLLLFSGALLALLFIGNAGEDEHHALAVLSAVMNSGGVDVEEFYLEGWAVVRDAGSPSSFWEKNRLGERLGLKSGEQKNIVTSEGELLQITQQAKGLQLQASVKEISNKGDQELYIIIECILAPDLEKSLAWEKRTREILSSLGKEHGIYLTVSGNIDSPMGEVALRGFGKAMFNTLGADVIDTLCTDRYVSFTGYAPLLLSDAAIIGREKINLNLAAVPQGQKTQILIGIPVISCEY